MLANETRSSVRRQTKNPTEYLRSITREDIPAIYDLNRAAGQLETITKKQWVALKEWFYFSGPGKNAPSAQALVYERGGHLLAFLGGTELPFKVDGKIVTAVAVGDLVVHPECKGPFGISFSLACIAWHAGKTIVGMHFSQLANAIWARLGAVGMAGSEVTFSGLVSLPNLLRIRLPWLAPVISVIDSVAGKRAWSPLAYLLKLRLVRWTSRANMARVLDIRASKTQLDQLCAKFDAAYAIGLHRNVEYLQWRYAEHPLCAYEAYALGTVDALEAVFILQRQSGGEIWLCEAIYDPSVPGICDNLLSACLDIASRTGGTFLLSKYVTPDFADSLREANFAEQRRGYHSFMIVSGDELTGPALFSYGDFKAH